MDALPSNNEAQQGEGRPSCPGLSMTVPGPQLGEDSFRRVVEWAPSAMVMIDSDGIMVLVNAQTERMFNYERAALIGQPVEMLVPARFRHHHMAYRTGFFGDSKPRPMGVGRDLAGCRADGSEFPVEIGLNPIDTEAGIMVLASGYSLLVSLLNLQADHAADPRLRAMLAESCGRVKAMALTHQLLYERKDFSRLDLGEYLERLMHSIRATYRGTGERIKLRLLLPAKSVPLDLERTIPCGLLLNELVTNSYKHVFPGERCGEILIELSEDGDGLVRFSIADDGIGLPPESELASHASLGLQLVPLLVEQLHGTLEIIRERGTQFSVCFPIHLVLKEA